MDPTTVSAFRRTRIFAIGTPEECRALSWGFRQFGSASVAPEITECPLGNIRAAKNEADFLVVFIDLGQPLPAAALNEVARDIPGTFVFTQPTPTQLLSVFQFPLWAAQVWDGSNGQNLAREITSHMVGAEKLVRQKIFFRDAQTILNEASRVPTNLEWMNPPRSLTSTKVALDSGRGIFTIGAQDSKSDLELPVSAKGPLLELRFVSGAWIPQVLNQGIKVQGIQSGKPVRSGDSIEIGGFVMVARAPDAINRLSALVKQEVNGFESPEETDQQPTLVAFLRTMMLRSFTGEIHLSSGLKRATVWLHSGGIDQVFSGPISGVKGLERILTWQNVTWKYREGSYSRPEDSSLKMQPTEFSIFAEHVQRTWERLVASAPPPNIVLTVDPARFSKMTSISPNQAMTLGAVSEFQLVRDILNYCPLPDLEILENLVAFRKSGLIRILK